MQRFTPLLIDAARPCRRSIDDRRFANETYIKVAGVWRYIYRDVDQHGQIIDVYVSKQRNIPAATRFFESALVAHGSPREVTTELAAPWLRVIDELIPEAFHDTGPYANSRVECDHGRLQARLRPTRSLRTERPGNRPDSVDRDHRARFHPKPTTLPLRTRHRGQTQASTRGPSF